MYSDGTSLRKTNEVNMPKHQVQAVPQLKKAASWAEDEFMFSYANDTTFAKKCFLTTSHVRRTGSMKVQ